jgi:hypothetical protein
MGVRYGEQNPTSGDASQAINIKVEKVSDVAEEVANVPITFHKIKTELEVRCMSLYVRSKKSKDVLHLAMEVCRTVRS